MSAQADDREWPTTYEGLKRALLFLSANHDDRYICFVAKMANSVIFEKGNFEQLVSEEVGKRCREYITNFPEIDKFAREAEAAVSEKNEIKEELNRQISYLKYDVKYYKERAQVNTTRQEELEAKLKLRMKDRWMKTYKESRTSGKYKKIIAKGLSKSAAMHRNRIVEPVNWYCGA